MKNYEDLRHALDTEILQAESLANEQKRQDFVTRTFTRLYRDYQAKRFDHATYVKLVNRLATYWGGAYNDYLDLLAGAATMGMLDIILAQKGNLAEQARARSQTVTDLTGVQPVQPEE
jgi:hypothetical protein